MRRHAVWFGKHLDRLSSLHWRWEMRQQEVQTGSIPGGPFMYGSDLNVCDGDGTLWK